MSDSRKRLIKWAAIAVFTTTAATAMLGCSTMGGGQLSPADKFAEAAAAYEVIQTSIEGAVTSGLLTPQQKTTLQAIDRLATDALVKGRQALADGNRGQVSYSTRVLEQATAEAKHQLGRPVSSGTITVDPGSVWQYNAQPMGGQ